jgi:hypothetical protein
MGDWDKKTDDSSTPEDMQAVKEFLNEEPTVNVDEQSDWLEDIKETVIIFGAPKIGKTFAYLGLVEDELEKNKEVQFYIINTDGGLARSFKDYFGDKSSEIKPHIHYYFASNIREAIAALGEIRTKAQPKDWIIMDLLSDFWDMAQDEFIRQSSGGNVADYIIKASKDPKKFGMFDSFKWNYVKKLDNEMTYVLPSRPICNVLGVCAEKDLEVESKLSAKSGGSDMVNLYKDIMARPAGQKQIAYKFNTILYISGITKKQVTVFGDRGKLKLGAKFTFEKNMWKAFKEQRNKSK